MLSIPLVFDHVGAYAYATYGIRACAIKEPKVLHFSAFHCNSYHGTNVCRLGEKVCVITHNRAKLRRN